MQVRGRIVILFVIVLGLVWNSATRFATVRAQDEITLERLFVSTDSNFAFFYPSSWKVQRSGPSTIMGEAQDVQDSGNKQAPKSLVLQIMDGDSAAFKLGPSDDLQALMAMIRPKDSSGEVPPIHPIQVAARDALRADLAAGSDVVGRVGNNRWMTLTAMGMPGPLPDNAAPVDPILPTFSF